MKHWKESKNQLSGKIILSDGDSDMVLSLKKEETGVIRFREECDKYFFISMSKEDAIKALEEAIEWIRCNDDHKN